MDELVSPRERQILTLIGMGKTSKEIAASLKISVATIGVHRRNICHKLGIHSTAALIQYAMAAGRDVATPAPDQKTGIVGTIKRANLPNASTGRS